MVKAYAAMAAEATLEPYEFEFGPLADNAVEVDVQYCGLCSSDVSMINNSWGRTTYPLVPGHEVIGTVAAVGSQVKRVAVGDQVGLGWHADYCMECHTCMSGDHNLCASAAPTIIGRHGGFAEKVRANAASVVKLPQGADPKTAGPLFCGGITVFNPLLEYNVKPTDKVAVIGIGGLGHLAIKFLRAWGCEVTAFTSTDAKRAEAIEMGAVATINSTSSADIEAHANEFDLVLSTVGVNLDWTTILTTLRPKGRLHLVGITVEPMAIGVMSLLRHQKAVSASPVGSPAAIATMLEFAAQHDIQPQIEMYPASQINDAIERLESGKARYRVVIDMQR
ncbi:MAG: NAD(P)-dependent alcohol dehydrogenase [Halioglobus sp.]